MSLPETMKAAVITAIGEPLALWEMPLPEIGDDQVLVRVRACGVCHTDLHAASGDWPIQPKLPVIPGHECAGEIAAVGARVSRLQIGDRVGVSWLHRTCGSCEQCVAGWETLCRRQQLTGFTVDGGYAEYVAADAKFVSPLPESLNWGAAAAILCAGVTAYKGIKETETRAGQWLAISGIGGLGHLAIQYAKWMGCNVVAIDVSEEKLQLARSLQADLAIHAGDDNAVKRMRSLTGGVHGALVSAVSTTAFTQAVSLLRPRGCMALVGIPPGTFSIPVFDLVLRRITLRGSVVGTRNDLSEALQVAAAGNVTPHITWDKLDNINAVLERLKAGKVVGRVVLKM